MIPPIPKQLMIHSAVLVTRYNADKWGNASTSDSVQLEHIRIEPNSQLVTDNSGAMVKLSATLFYDCKNSSPAEVAFALKDDTVNGKAVDIQQLVFGGRTYTVQTIEPLYATSNKVHHYEVGLV